MEKLPSLSATAVPKTTSPFNNVTVELASALPIIMGEVSFELEAREVGASGAVVSIVIEREEDLEETLPAESVADALIEYSPSEIAEEGVKEKAPLLSAVVVPRVEESIKSVTLESASALPVIVGVESLVIEEEVAREVGASGAVVSIVIELSLIHI